MFAFINLFKVPLIYPFVSTKRKIKNKYTCTQQQQRICLFLYYIVASYPKEVNPRLAKRPLVFNERLANRGLTSLVKEATGGPCASGQEP